MKTRVKPVAAPRAHIQSTNDVFKVVTKKENKNNFNDCGDVKVLGGLGGRLRWGWGGIAAGRANAQRAPN